MCVHDFGWLCVCVCVCICWRGLLVWALTGGLCVESLPLGAALLLRSGDHHKIKLILQWMNKSCELIRTKLIQFGNPYRHYCQFSGAFSGSLQSALPVLGQGMGLASASRHPHQYAAEHSWNPLVTTLISLSLWCIISRWGDISRLSALSPPGTMWSLFGGSRHRVWLSLEISLSKGQTNWV